MVEMLVLQTVAKWVATKGLTLASNEAVGKVGYLVLSKASLKALVKAGPMDM